MATLLQQEYLIPYRSIGCFTSTIPPVYYSMRDKNYLSVATEDSFKILRLPKLEVILLGPGLGAQPVTSIQCLNEEIYVTNNKQLFVFNYNHLLAQYSIIGLPSSVVKTEHQEATKKTSSVTAKGKKKNQSKVGDKAMMAAINKTEHIETKMSLEENDESITCALLLGKAYIVGTSSPSLLIYETSGPAIELYTQTELGFVPRQIVHPATYLNKILVAGDKDIQLWNIKTCQMIFSFGDYLSPLLCKLGSTKGGATATVKMLSLVMSPVIDVAAVGLSDGQVIGFNLKQAKTVFAHKQSHAVSAIGFSRDTLSDPLLVIGDAHGALNIYDLNKGILVERMDDLHCGRIISCEFVLIDNQEYMISTCADDNSIKMWVRDETNKFSFRALRQRQGAQNPIKQIRFYGSDGFHLLGFTSSAKGEMVDFSTINESFTTPFSTKTAKKFIAGHLNSEGHKGSMSSITSFGFSTFRDGDWANILTSHDGQKWPGLWSMEDHTVVQKGKLIELGSTYDMSRSEKIKGNILKKRVITSTFATNCGNFGVVGFDDGLSVKFNMQSGTFLRSFNWGLLPKTSTSMELEKTADEQPNVTGIIVDKYNRNIITGYSCEENGLGLWDFLAGIPKRSVNIPGKGVAFIRESPVANIAIVASFGGYVSLFELGFLEKFRDLGKLEDNACVNDACFTPDGRKVIVADDLRHIIVWDILIGAVTVQFTLDNVCASLDLSSAGDLLAMVYESSKKIHLWHVRSLDSHNALSASIELHFLTPIATKPKDLRAKYFSQQPEIKQEKKENMVIDSELSNLALLLKQDEKMGEISEIEFTNVPSTKWMPLRHWSEIKERNKPQRVGPIETHIPFFLDMGKNVISQMDKADRDISTLYQETQRTESDAPNAISANNNKQLKIFEENGDLNKEFVGDLSKLLSKIGENKLADLNEKTVTDIFNYLKTSAPALVEFEFRKIALDSDEKGFDSLLQFFKALLKRTDDMDIKHVYFATFLIVIIYPDFTIETNKTHTGIYVVQ